MPLITIASIALSTVMTVGMVLHFNAFPANHSDALTFGAPSVNYQRSLIPIDSTENLGTTTSPWDELHVNEICLGGDCETVWPAGSGPSFDYLFPSDATTTVLTFTNGINSPKLTNLTSNGFVKTSGSDGTLSVDTATYSTSGYPFAGTGNSTSTLTRFLGGASTTAFSANTLAVGGTATTSIASDGALTAPSATINGTLAMGANNITSTGRISSSASPLQALWATWATTTNASTTAFSARTAAIGGTATTTVSSAGAVVIPSGLTVSDLTSAGLITNGSGVFAEYAGTSCTNQFVRSLSALMVATCASINNGDWSGTDLSVANGGTGLSTFGGTNHILYTTAADTLASEAAFTYAASTDLLTAVNASTTRATTSGGAWFNTGAADKVGFASSTAWGAVSLEIFGTSPAFVVSNQGSTTPAFAIMGDGVAQNATRAGFIGIATSSPWSRLTLDRDSSSAQNASSSITVTEYAISTSTNKTLDWRDSNNQLFRIGASATTISFTGYVPGQKLVLTVCNPNASAGAITWGTQVLWTGGSAPSQTTTANKCDVWSFIATYATSSIKIFGAQTANF